MIVRYIDNTKYPERNVKNRLSNNRIISLEKKDSTSTVEKQVPSNKMNDKKHLI